MWELHAFVVDLVMPKQLSLQENLNDLGMRHNMDIQTPLKDRPYHPRNRVMSTTNRRHNISFSCLYLTLHVVYAVC